MGRYKYNKLLEKSDDENTEQRQKEVILEEDLEFDTVCHSSFVIRPLIS
jgi:hypothetical protein